MQDRKLDVLFTFFPYGGNGGISSEVPDIREWMVKTILDCRGEWAKDRIGRISSENFSDTPITLTRNRAVTYAREHKFDVLVMCDSDQKPDMYVGSDPEAKPFFQSSFDYLYQHWEKGPVCIGAPYCGPPPYENPYAGHWTNQMTDVPQGGHWEAGETNGDNETDMQMKMWDRYSAAQMRGIQDASSLPTGLIMFDMRCFDLTDPIHEFKYLTETLGMSCEDAKAHTKPWFYYEHKSIYQDQKASTEDITMTRDLALAGFEKLGYNPVKCNFGSWAGHWKPKCVGKPSNLVVEDVGHKLRAAVMRNQSREVTRQLVDFKLPPEIAARIAGLQPTITTTEGVHVGNGAA